MLVTGANGFVGRAVVERLVSDAVAVRAGVRQVTAGFATPVQVVEVEDIDGGTSWGHAVEGVDAVIHCAARVHQLNDGVADPLATFRRINRDGTANLARQAAANGVRRMVFISSIGVNGAETVGQPFRATDTPAPHSPYAVSKHEAELALQEIARVTGMGVTIIRPPLVYGPGAPGNFSLLLRILDRGLPLPFEAVRNRRSFVAIENLVDLAVLALRRPEAAGKTLLVSDDDDLSTPELLRRTAKAMGRRARLFPVPVTWIRGAATLFGRQELALRLCGSLQVDIAPTCRVLGWRPPVGVNDALVHAAQHFRSAEA